MTTATQYAPARSIRIPAWGTKLDGDLTVPKGASGIILFAHGSGSSRHSPRNRVVAEHLNRDGFATLLMDLLTREEEQADLNSAELRFNIPLLAGRLIAATDWVCEQPELRELPVGYFGASTGAAAALVAAAERPEVTGAVVSRGGRPDLAGDALGRVFAPTLLIVGGDDAPVIALNEDALRRLRCDKKMAIIPHATHLFEEPGALEQVADAAAEWFQRHLPPLLEDTADADPPPQSHYMPPPRHHPSQPWILIADASRALILALRDRQHLEVVRELSHPAGRAHGRDLTPDRPGRIAISASGRTARAMDRHTPPKEVEAEKFVRRIAEVLQEARDIRAFDALALVAPPHFLGLLRNALSPGVRRTIVTSAHKDLTWMQPDELHEHLQEVTASLV